MRATPGWLALLALCFAACTEVKKVDAPTQIMLRIGVVDAQLRQELTQLRVTVSLRDAGQWKQPASQTFPGAALLWPVDVPVTPRLADDASNQFEVVVEALGSAGALAEARAVTNFVENERRVLELWLFACPVEGAVCAPRGCHGESCSACTSERICAPVGITEGSALPGLAPDVDWIDGAVEADDAEAAIDAVVGEAGAADAAVEMPISPDASDGAMHLPEVGDDGGDQDALTPREETGPEDAGDDADSALPDDGGTAEASTARTCSDLPAQSDYAGAGPFADARMYERIGPSANYTLFRPDTSLGRDGFKHPIVAWASGISSAPRDYQQTLTLVASHGFVIIACNDAMVERACLSAGMDWLIEQNKSGAMQGKLDTGRELAIGHSWGGGAAIDLSDRPNVKATVSVHGMPPRVNGIFQTLHAPLLLLTSTGDTFVSPSTYVTPNYNSSNTVPTFYGTLQDQSVDNLFIVDEGAAACAGNTLLGACGSAKQQRAPLIAWLRYWACDDSGAREFFFGADCTLCKGPWSAQRKPASSWH